MLREFPLLIQAGSVLVNIYRRKLTQKKHRYTVVWRDPCTGRRRRRSYQAKRGKGGNSLALKRAKAKGQDVANKIESGNARALKLTLEDAHIYDRASQSVKPTGIPLDMAAAEWAQAKALLGDQASVIEVARDYVRRNPKSAPRRTVPQVWEEMEVDARKRKLSPLYLADLRSRCGRFADHFDVPITSLTTQAVKEWLNGLEIEPGTKIGARTHNNFLRSIRTLFEFAKGHGYLPKDHAELDAIKPVKETAGEIEIFTPEEIARLLAAAPLDFLPAMAICAFSGLRSAEVERLEWSEVRFAARVIEIKASKAKTASRRLAPITDNLQQWLHPYAKQSGRVWPHGHAYFYEVQKSVAARTATKEQPAAVQWKHNALRHSFISYRLAAIQNVHQVALEAGNSSQVIFSNYRELVTAEQAAQWFSIGPKQPENITAMPGAAAASAVTSPSAAAAESTGSKPENGLAPTKQSIRR